MRKGHTEFIKQRFQGKNVDKENIAFDPMKVETKYEPENYSIEMMKSSNITMKI